MHSDYAHRNRDLHSDCTHRKRDLHSDCAHRNTDVHSDYAHGNRDAHSDCANGNRDVHNHCVVNKGCCRLVLQDVPSSLYACQQRLSPCPARYPLPLCAWLHVSAHPVSLHFVSESMLEQECDSLVSQVRKMQDPQSNMEQLKPSMRDLKTGGGGGS